MSAIGDYIHYNSSNYRLWGITRPKEYNTPSHYSGTLANYIIKKRELKSSTTGFDYASLEQNVQRNSLINIMKDQQLVNLDYGRKINQFKSMLIARAEGKTVAYRENLSKRSRDNLMQYKDLYNKLQHNITVINKRLSKGQTVPNEWLEKVSKQYQQFQNLSGRVSALGNIQQGLNDYAARIWKKTLDGVLGKKIDEFTKESAKAYLEKQLKNNITSSNNMIVETDISPKKQVVYQTTDKSNSTYIITATEDGWEINTMQNRENILKGTLKNIYADDSGYQTFTLGGQISLMTVLALLENEDRFSTHWLNRHSNHLDSSLDKELQTAIIYETITQNRKQSSLSEDFVYIDRNSGQIKRATFWSIVEMTKFDVQPNLVHHKFSNEWAAPGEPSYKGSIVRINNLLKQVHAMNMIVASKPISI